MKSLPKYEFREEGLGRGGWGSGLISFVVYSLNIFLRPPGAELLKAWLALTIG